MDTTSIKITLLCLSYRDKRIIDTIQDALDKCGHPENVSLMLSIQDSYHHKVARFSKNDTIDYFLWDNFEGFARHRARMVTMANPQSHILFISSATVFTNNWDINLNQQVNSSAENAVISKVADKFSLDGTLIHKGLLTKIGYPNYLRLLGEEEDLSIKLYANGYPVLDGMDEVLETQSKKDYDHIPFSTTHNYNEVQDLYKNGVNKFCDLRSNISRVKDYAERYPIKKIHHQLNEVEYYHSQIRHLDNTRFHHHGSRV